MMIDHNKILACLRDIKDPNTGLDILSAKMVENLVVEGNSVNFSINLKIADQNLKSQMNFACIQRIQQDFPQADVNIFVKMPNENTLAAGNLPQVKNVIAVASGKGGVGKSTVAVNIAVSLAKLGYKVGLLDADVYGPSIPTMLGIQKERPKIETLYGKHKIVPVPYQGMHVISIGLIVEPEQAIVLRGPRLGGIIRQFIHECLWPELDYMIIDLPPGTGDVQLTLVQTLPITGVVMVTTPQEVAIIDAVKAMNMFLLPNINVPIVGVVENMSWFTPEELPNNKYFLFGQGGGKALASQADTQLLGQIPLVQGVREGGDEGRPAAGTPSMVADVFEKIAQKLVVQVNQRNQNVEPTRIVEIKN